jgi:hypothetical protein
VLHYYLNLCDKNIDRALAIKSIAQDQFEQFERYLRNSIAALERKAEIKAAWEAVKTENLAELSIIGGLYEFQRQTTIRINNNKKGYYRIEILSGNPNFNKNIEYKIGDTEGEAIITESDYDKGIIYLEGVDAVQFDAARWGFTDIALAPAWTVVQKAGVFYDGKGIDYKIAALEGDEITVYGQLTSDTELLYEKAKISFTVIRESALPFQDIHVINEDKNTVVFYSSKRLENTDKNRQINTISNFIDYNNIFYESEPESKLLFERQENSHKTTIILQDDSDYGKVVVSNNIRFRVNQLQQNNQEKWKIQLKEISENEEAEDEQNALSPLRYFFGDDVTIKDDQKNEYSVERSGSDQDEQQIILRREPTEEEKQRHIYKPYCFPTGEILSVKVDTHQLDRQREAVSILKKMPHKGHEMLIRLFENRDVARWNPPKKNVTVTKWFVLKDDERSGCPEQRDFVRKALSTPDFAILEGPPGSGKTTVILELICQIVSGGKRVLLCGSTNVSIDNVLERLIEKKDGQSLLDSLDLLPVRIGRERVDPKIDAYQLDNLIKDIPEEERNWRRQLLLEAANLVCGTTMGITNHPKFREQKGRVYGLTYSGDTPIVPEFDYLIIDESSKTTFQEFLVPALYANRWILAGDVMQLSPFTDAENIEFNFEQLSLGKNKPLDKNIQKAVFYLDKMQNFSYWKDNEGNLNPNRFVFLSFRPILEKMMLELAKGRLDKFEPDTIFIFIVNEEINLEMSSDNPGNLQKREHENVLIRTPENINFLELTAANIILVEDSLFKSIIDKLPATHAILQKPGWESMPYAFYHNAFRQKGGFEYRSRGRKIAGSFDIVEEINKELREGNWAKELTWRMGHEHQLRYANGSSRKRRLGYKVDDLTPFSVDRECFVEARDLVAAMSFPSILESLVTGIKGKKPSKPSTITEVLIEDDLNPRKTTLVFQHRMHPEISAFPRKQFYRDSDALRDLERPRPISESRQWDYPRYEKRNVWIDVKKPTKVKGRENANIYEVDAMMRHLRDFLDYAVNHPQPEGKEWEVACLAFYRRQEKLIREGGDKFGNRGRDRNHVNGLQTIIGSKIAISNFDYNWHKTKGPYTVHIRLHSLDRFQGHEADVVFLSMSRTDSDGFLDSPNRLNVSITRAKFQLVIFGNHEYFSERSRSEDLRELAKSSHVFPELV